MIAFSQSHQLSKDLRTLLGVEVDDVVLVEAPDLIGVEQLAAEFKSRDVVNGYFDGQRCRVATAPIRSASASVWANRSVRQSLRLLGCDRPGSDSGLSGEGSGDAPHEPPARRCAVHGEPVVSSSLRHRNTAPMPSSRSARLASTGLECKFDGF